MNKVKITSGGLGTNTNVSIGGIDIPGISNIIINEIRPNNQVTATITLLDVDLDLLVGAEIVLDKVPCGYDGDDEEEHF